MVKPNSRKPDFLPVIILVAIAGLICIVIWLFPYRWNGDGGPSPKAWYTDVDDNTKEEELAYLRKQIYQRDVEVPLRPVTAYERFSDRI